jgi:hypothetical protein
MKEQLKIRYDYKFSNGLTKKFDLHLDKETLSLVSEQGLDLPEWVGLEYKQCANCKLDKTLHPYCPVAANLSGITQEFSGITADDAVHVTVTVKERIYAKVTSMREGLSPLLGIIMSTSGCPSMEPLKPMVRFHLPFASLEETVFRMTSMFLVAQLIREQAGKKPEWRLEGLSKIYEEVKKVNKDFSQRMITAARRDTNVDALVNLNVFAVMVPLVAEKMLKEITPYFSAYLK